MRGLVLISYLLLVYFSFLPFAVQESLSSMTEQPNGGSLIDNLRYVVRHCQPVQVHINLHPQVGSLRFPLLTNRSPQCIILS